MDRTAQFWELGWCQVNDLLDAKQLLLAQKAIEASRRNGLMHLGTHKVDLGTLNEYAPTVGQVLLGHLLPFLEKLVARPLLPGYSYWRIYETSHQLPRHLDRYVCEISVTMTLASDPIASDWPMKFTDLTGTNQAVSLPPGAAVVYQGCRVPHEFEPFGGRENHQLILHYVLADGENAERAPEILALWAQPG
ncbi:MAG: hypothetical protein K2W81_15815 [Sphingomonas sp.]|uniref:hypothetical protein n=1 Tax=Sphingomonas sp. TaxID=28214 RepID=UPI0025E14965|nr:hypothetical protein [Sphingomonas sp.]MBY0285411.1 hypothetical protein [Sphingomonas sp.]